MGELGFLKHNKSVHFVTNFTSYSKSEKKKKSKKTHHHKCLFLFISKIL